MSMDLESEIKDIIIFIIIPVITLLNRRPVDPHGHVAASQHMISEAS